jgi:hypothetical protein
LNDTEREEPPLDTTVVVPAWGPYVGEPLLDALGSLRRQDDPAHLVVVDNASDKPLASLQSVEFVRAPRRLTVGAARLDGAGADAICGLLGCRRLDVARYAARSARSAPGPPASGSRYSCSGSATRTPRRYRRRRSAARGRARWRRACRTWETPQRRGSRVHEGERRRATTALDPQGERVHRDRSGSKACPGDALSAR